GVASARPSTSPLSLHDALPILKPFKEGDLIFTGPNLPHVWRNENRYFEDDSTNQTSGIVIYFQEDFLDNSIRKKEELSIISCLLDRKSTRLNSSHVKISYAVFC